MSSYKGAYVPWRGSSGSNPSSYSSSNNQTNSSGNSTNSTNNSTSSVMSKYTSGNSSSPSKTDSTAQKLKESSYSTSNTSNTGSLATASALSRFSSSRSSLGSSSAGSNLLNGTNNVSSSSGASSSTNSSSSAKTKRENSFNASSSLSREKSGLSSTATAMLDKLNAMSSATSSLSSGGTSASRERDKREGSASSSIAARREKSGLGSSSSTTSSSSMKREKSNVGSNSSSSTSSTFTREKSGGGLSSAASARLTNIINNNLSNSSKLLSSYPSNNDSSSSTSASGTSASAALSSSYRPSSYLRSGSDGVPMSNSSRSSQTSAAADLLSSKISSLVLDDHHGKKTGLNLNLSAMGSGLSSGNVNSTTSGNTNTAPSAPGLGYRLYTAKNVKESYAANNPASGTVESSSSSKPIGANTAAMTSSLRTTARFGLRSGTSHALYNSSLPSKVTDVPLTEEVKPRLLSSRQEASKSRNNGEPVTWMSRGTSPSPPNSTDNLTAAKTKSEISMDRVPSINPNHDITIVVKNKEVQTDEKLSASPTTLHKYISSIPRPSTTYYSPFNTAMSRFSSNSNKQQQGSYSGGSSSELNLPNSNDSKLPSSNNSNNNLNSTGSTSGSTSSSNRASPHGSNATNTSPHASPSRKAYENLATNKSPGSPNNPSSIILTLPNKEFRKSALNVGLESREAEEEFNKKQEELRILNKGPQNPVVSPTGAGGLGIGGLGGSKRDLARRPPTDPNKTSLLLSNNPQSRSMTKLPGSTGLQKSTSINANALSKIKSGKNIIPIRKNSTSSCSESESSSSMSSSSVSGSGSGGSSAGRNPKKPTMNFKNGNGNGNLDNKVQSRRGSVTSTSCSSAASSRSSSAERSRCNSYSKTSGVPLSSRQVNNNDPSTSPTSASAPAAVHGENSLLSNTNGNDPSRMTSHPAEEGPKQTSFLLRALASAGEKLAWVRRCESGEIPWWMASNTNIPGMVSRNPSSAALLTKSPTTKQIAIQEESHHEIDCQSDSDDNCDDSDAETNQFHLQTNHSILHSKSNITMGSVPLGERTSPDGTEITSSPNSPKTTLSSFKDKSLQNNKLFISNMTNIDDILGTFSPPPVSTPVKVTTPMDCFPPAVAADIVQAFSQNEIDKGSSDESSDDEQQNEDDLSDDGSTGTSSSFEEVDPSSIAVASLPVPIASTLQKCPSNQFASSSSSSGALLQPPLSSALNECTEGMSSSSSSQTAAASATTSGGLIPQSQRDKLDDATLQLYKDGDYGTYLDLEASISEQQEDFDGFLNNRKNSIILRAQLPVRVHAIIEKLLNSDGRELRRALFSLKQIFQEDKDLVHEFVENGGLSSLIKVGSEADQNYQNYILRAIGQVMLYVDGMYGVMRHNETIQWLYSLVASKFRLVQKTALKLLLVFVDYVESNCLLLVQAVTTVDILKGSALWSNIVSLLREHDSGDTELLVYAMTLVNKVLNGIPDIDTYYDQVDALEEQGMATLIQKYMGKQCADLDLLQQFQIYEVVLKHEDGEEDIMMQLDESMRQKLLNRKGYGELEGSGGNKERRKSRRHSANGTPPSTPTAIGSSAPFLTSNSNSRSHPTVRRLSSTGETRGDNDDWSSSTSSSHSSSPAPNGSVSPVISNGYTTDKCFSNEIDVTPGLRRRRERAERQKSLLLEQKQVNGIVNGVNSHECNGNGHTTDDSMGSPATPSSPIKNPDSISLIPLGRSNSSKKDILSVVSTNGNENSVTMSGTNGNNCANNKSRPWMLPVYTNNKANGTGSQNGEKENSMEKDIVGVGLGESEKVTNGSVTKRENTVKDLTQKLANQSLLTSPVDENKSFSRTGDLSGVVLKAKEGLAKSKSRADIKPPQPTDVVNGTNSSNNGSSLLEVKKSDNELHWDFLVSNLNRPLEICDLDFKDLKDVDDTSILAPSPHLLNGGNLNGFPPPVPSMNGFSLGPPPPPPALGIKSIPPPPMNGLLNGGLNGLIRGPPAPPLFGIALKHQNNNNSNNDSNLSNKSPSDTGKKTKKTVKLFWKEVREDPVTAMKIQKVGCIWDELAPIPLDTQRLEHLFESRAKDVITKEKQTDMNKSKEIVVLDPKRSNAINIGMTKLPPPRTIKAAIMKMDATIINREGIEKLLTMLPTDEEKGKIQEAQFANPEIPLGSAEQFLLTLASISELTARLKLWAFKLDYDNLEKEVAEPLMDLKQGLEALEKNKTFRCILTTLLCIGNFLNGAEAKGFQIDYLAKVPEVKDTVHKHSLLHHLCHIVIEKFPESTDLYSEIGPVTRASRVDFEDLASNLAKMETDCKASWDHLRVIAKHDGPTNMKLKMSEFLADCAERIIVLGIVHRRVINRYHKFLLWLGVLAHQVTTTKPQILFKIVSEFALEYRTTRERVIQQLQKKANHRERNKTRGKMITEQLMYKTKEDKADAELQRVLKKTTTDAGDGEVVRSPLTWTRRPNKSQNPNIHNNNNHINSNNNKCATLNGHGTLTDGDDEILESLVKTATQTPATRAAPRERKRNSRYSDRKSLRRTLRHGLSEEERKLLAAFMANGHTF